LNGSPSSGIVVKSGRDDAKKIQDAMRRKASAVAMPAEKMPGRKVLKSISGRKVGFTRRQKHLPVCFRRPAPNMLGETTVVCLKENASRSEKTVHAPDQGTIL